MNRGVFITNIGIDNTTRRILNGEIPNKYPAARKIISKNKDRNKIEFGEFEDKFMVDEGLRLPVVERIIKRKLSQAERDVLKAVKAEAKPLPKTIHTPPNNKRGTLRVYLNTRGKNTFKNVYNFKDVKETRILDVINSFIPNRHYIKEVLFNNKKIAIKFE